MGSGGVKLGGLDLLPMHGELVIFAWSFLVQLGLPLPALPMLLGAGALAGLGQMSLPAALMTAVGATLLADTIWYTVGRLRGSCILEMFVRFSLAHEASIRRAKHLFFTHRVWCLIVAKFLPGINPLAAGLAGIFAMAPAEFFMDDAAGALLWAGAWMATGYVWADMIGTIVHDIPRIGAPLLGVAGVSFIGYLVFRHIRLRQRLLQRLRQPRLSADDLKRRLDAQAPTAVIDLRTALEVATDPVRIPGAQLVRPHELDPRQLPPKGEIVLYCTEPHEATSARTANELVAGGLTRVHVLRGGLAGWRRRGFPVEELRRAT